MIDRKHDLPISKQAEALNISRGSVYYLPRPVPKTELAIMHRLDRLHLEYPFAGSRMLRGLLAAEGYKIGRRHVRTLMRRMGIEALYRRSERVEWLIQLVQGTEQQPVPGCGGGSSRDRRPLWTTLMWRKTISPGPLPCTGSSQLVGLILLFCTLNHVAIHSHMGHL